MPSPMKSVLARAVSRADDLQLLLGRLAGVDLADADPLGQVAHLRLAVAGDEQHALEAMLRAAGGGRTSGPRRAAASRNRSVAA